MNVSTEEMLILRRLLEREIRELNYDSQYVKSKVVSAQISKCSKLSQRINLEIEKLTYFKMEV